MNTSLQIVALVPAVLMCLFACALVIKVRSWFWRSAAVFAPSILVAAASLVLLKHWQEIEANKPLRYLLETLLMYMGWSAFVVLVCTVVMILLERPERDLRIETG